MNAAIVTRGDGVRMKWNRTMPVYERRSGRQGYGTKQSRISQLKSRITRKGEEEEEAGRG